MAEETRGDMFAGGQEALAMLQRMERLKKLMGTTVPKEQPAVVRREGTFLSSERERMITAAIPFLDQEYQRSIYVIVRLLEMQRVLGGGLLEMREKQEGPPAVRRQKLLRTMQTYLPEAEQKQVDMLLKLMMMKELAGWEEKK